MTPINLPRRYLQALLLAVLLGCLFGVLNSQASECDPDDPNSTCFVVYWPGMCSYMEPYSYWWYFWACNERMDLVAETVTYHELPHGRFLVEILREYPGGERATLIRELRGRQ